MIAFADATALNQNISSDSCFLKISGINSTSFAALQAIREISLSIKMELQKLKNGTYTTVETGFASKTGSIISITETGLINALAACLLKVTFKTGSETIVRYAYP